jgi:hypothetical protein
MHAPVANHVCKIQPQPHAPLHFLFRRVGHFPGDVASTPKEIYFFTAIALCSEIVRSRIVSRSTVKSPISNLSMRPWRMPSLPIANAPTATAPTAIAPTAAAPIATASSANPVDAEIKVCFRIFIMGEIVSCTSCFQPFVCNKTSPQAVHCITSLKGERE